MFLNGNFQRKRSYDMPYLQLTADNISLEEIQKLKDSMDKRLISVISNHGEYIHV